MPNFAGTWTLTTQAQARGQNLWPAIPGAPTIGTATAGAGSASVAFTAPTNTGYPATITSYTVTSSPGGFTGTGASSPITVSGLTNGTSYTFTVTATNATGTGPASAASNSVTPIANPTYLIGDTTALSTPTTSKSLFGYGIVADSQLNYYVVSSYQTGSPNNGPQLTKYDKNGVIQWQKALLSGFGNGYTVAIDSSDNLYVGGNIALPSEYARMVLLKYNSSGTFQFQKTYNVTSTYNCQIRKIVVDSSGNIYCAVISNANTSGSNNNGYVMKLDSTGAVTWIKGLGTLNTNIGEINMFGVGVDSSSNVYINGWYQTATLTNQAAVSQLSSTGTFNWRVGTNAVVSPAKNFYAQGGVTDSSGNTVICGVTPTGSVQEGGFIKYDNAGNITWQIRFGDATNSLLVSAVALDGSGNIYSTGYYISGRAVMFVAKHNSSGVYQWHRTLSNNGLYDVQGTGIYASSVGNVYATGYVGENTIPRFDSVVMVLDTNGNTSNTGTFALNGFNLTLGTLGAFSSSSTTLTANTNSLGFFTPTVNVLTNIGTETTTGSTTQTAVLGTTPSSYATQKAIFGYGADSSYNPLSMTNLVSNTGVVAANTTGVGSARWGLAAAGYGTDKAIFGYGCNGSVGVNTVNLVSNTGVVAGNSASAGTGRWDIAAAGYGTDKAIFGYGQTNGSYSGGVSITNLISNTGVVSGDTTGVGTVRSRLAAAGYGGDKAIFGYGILTSGSGTAITNLVSNTGVVATDTAGVGSARSMLAAAGYGGDKAIFGYGGTAITNLVSNTGVVSTDTTGVGTSRFWLAAAGYGGDKAIFGYGNNNAGTSYSMTNLVSNTGVVASDTTGVGTSRHSLAAAGYSLS